ncbi:hypothetical protein U1Q18_030858, partial [Sarracenia purpurea var. burkii]
PNLINWPNPATLTSLILSLSLSQTNPSIGFTPPLTLDSQPHPHAQRRLSASGTQRHRRLSLTCAVAVGQRRLRLRRRPHAQGSTPSPSLVRSTRLLDATPSPTAPFASGIMGRKAGGLFISPKKFGSLQKPCMKEMMTFLNCLALNKNSDEKVEKCLRQKELLNTCMDAQKNKSRKPWGSINYQLQRLGKGRK